MAWSTPRTWTTGERVTAAHMNQEVRDNFDAVFPDEEAAASWSPTMTGDSANPAFLSTEGRQYRVGAVQFVWARFVFDGSGVGRYECDLPVAAANITGSGSAHKGQAIGSWAGGDDTALAANSRGGPVLLRDSTHVIFVLAGDSVGDGRSVESDRPFVWNDNDVLSFHAVYPVA